MSLKDIRTKTKRRVAAAVLAVTAFFSGAIDRSAEFISHNLPEAAAVKKFAAEMGEVAVKAARKLAGKAAKEEGKKLYKEGKKKLNEYNEKSNPKTFTLQPSYILPKHDTIPLTKEEEEFQKKYGINTSTLESTQKPLLRGK